MTDSQKIIDKAERVISEMTNSGIDPLPEDRARQLLLGMIKVSPLLSCADVIALRTPKTVFTRI